MLRNFDIDLAEMPIAVAPAVRRQSSDSVKIAEQPEVSISRDTHPVAYWAECMVRIRDDRDQKAFVEVFQYFGPRVKSFLMKSGADAALAEDCVQDVMTTVWRKAHLFDPTRASVSTWVFTIARNRNIDIARRQRRAEPEELGWGPQPEPEQTEVIGLQQETEQLGQALASLPKEQRTMVEKAYFGDLSHSEIAAETGLPLGTIKSRIRLALERLRKGLT